MTEGTGKRNPFLGVDAGGKAIYQLKQALVLYLDYPPGPNRARLVYDKYMQEFGSQIRTFQSTSWLGPPHEWLPSSRTHFEDVKLPDLQRHSDWGYGFSDGRDVDSHLFMFHGYRPATEAGKASFFRFEWPWDWEADKIASFTLALADLVPFLSGTGGFIISARPFEPEAYARMYALCRRYWGLEAWNLDLTVNFVLRGYKCPSWLTLIGHRLLEQSSKPPPELARITDYGTAMTHGIVFQSRDHPEFIDRNRREPYAGESRIAHALLPLQITEHDDLGPGWEGRTMDWLYRFAAR